MYFEQTPQYGCQLFTCETFLANGEREQHLKIPRSSFIEMHTYLHIYIYLFILIVPVTLKASGYELISIYNKVTFWEGIKHAVEMLIEQHSGKTSVNNSQ